MQKIRYAAPWLHAACTIILGLFFLLKGFEKFGEPKLREKHITLENREAIVEQIIIRKDYSPPFGYDLTMNTFRQSGFIRFIGCMQIAAGLLMFLPRTRFAGLLLLLPIILNIFLMHYFFDNRPHENIETGRLLLFTLLLTGYYHKELRRIFWLKKTD